MLNGSELYRILKPDYPLFIDDAGKQGRFCFETFPQAVACALAGKLVSAKAKSTVRRELVRNLGIDTSGLNNIDFVDATLCAVTAHYLVLGNVKTYGDDVDGFIVVPGV
jgi:predicted RNase H-like nuclease